MRYCILLSIDDTNMATEGKTLLSPELIDADLRNRFASSAHPDECTPFIKAFRSLGVLKRKVIALETEEAKCLEQHTKIMDAVQAKSLETPENKAYERYKAIHGSDIKSDEARDLWLRNSNRYVQIHEEAKETEEYKQLWTRITEIREAAYLAERDLARHKITIIEELDLLCTEHKDCIIRHEVRRIFKGR